MMKTTIELWLDLSCPWCQGALPVMRHLLAEEAPQAQVVWRPVRLHPLDLQGRDFQDYLRGYDADPTARAKICQELVDYNLTRGREIDFVQVKRLHHPGLAHGLLALAREAGGVDMWALASALWDANWRDGVDISDLARLREVASLPEPLWTQLAEGKGAELVNLDRQRASEIGLDGVPRFYLNGVIVPAWLDPEVVRSKLRDALPA